MRSTTAILAVLLTLSQTAAADLLGEVHPLAPLNSSGPRETLKSFNESFSESIVAYQSELDWSDTDAESYMLDLKLKASRLLDLTGIPPARRDDVTHLGVVQLQEILDRIELPPYDDVPDRNRAKTAGIDRWTIPNTEIVIARVEKGARRGEWLFSPDTVSRLGEFYSKVEDLPYKDDAILGRLGDDIPFYEYMLYSPGALIPVELILALPPWANESYGDLLTWQWIGVVVLLVVAFALLIFVFRVCRRAAPGLRERPIAQAWLRTVTPVVSAATFYVTEYFIDDQLSVCCATQAVLETALLSASLFFAAWTIVALGGVVAELILQSPRIRSESVDASLVRIVTRVTSLLIAIWVLLDGVESFGISFIPVIAGLGIGGLAIALAVRPTLENVIGGFILFADRPVRVGDFCRFGEQMGTIEEIGIRSTRIRTLSDTLLTVPNAEFSQLQLENFAKRSRILYWTTIGLRYETTPDQLRHVLARLRETFLGHPKVAADNLRVRFRSFGDFALEIELRANIRTNVWLEFVAIREDLNFRIMDVVRESGTAFALPSQTAYFTRDAGMDDALARAAEDEVAEWRRGEQLPFPDFDEGRYWEIEDVLDYPPAGSPHHEPREPRGPPPADPAGRGGKG